MSIRRLIRKYWKPASVIVTCWTFLGLLFTPQTYLVNLRSPTPLTWGQALVATLLLFQVWAVLTPNGQTGKGKRVAKWAADGNGIEVNETSTFDGPEGAVNIQMSRVWTLSADGKTLKIDITADGPSGKQQVKRTFTKK